MSIALNDLEKAINSGLTTAVKKSEISFGQLYIVINIEDIISTILFLKTNEKCKFRQLIDITAVDYPHREKRFKIVYLFLSHENNLRIILNIDVDEKSIIPSITTSSVVVIIIVISKSYHNSNSLYFRTDNASILISNIFLNTIYIKTLFF